MQHNNRKESVPFSGFTLIELSIVLVIIGLIIGGILTGQDLISAAAQRAQIAQIEKYNTAARTFQGKFGYLPGDIPNPYATNFGFATRGAGIGEGDGNGMLAGIDSGAFSNSGIFQGGGETVMFWVDLSTAGLIDGSFNTAVATTTAGADVTGGAVGNYLPSAKIGQGNSLYTWGAGTFTSQYNYNGLNYFGISRVPTIASSTNFGKIGSGAPGLAVNQAYNIDKKIDDGLPQSGNVIAIYLWGVNGDPLWTDGLDTLGGNPPNTAATAGSSTTCMDNGGLGGSKHYSIEENGGTGLNCGMSFKFQ